MTEPDIILAPTVLNDLDAFFRFQLDREALYMAAFTAKDPTNKTAYLEKYSRFLSDPSIHMRTILFRENTVGSIAKFMIGKEAEITYWIDRQYWGMGIATAALKCFLNMEPTRPIQGRVAFDNYGSQKVLEKCGFVKTGTDIGFSNARLMDIEEYIYRLTGR